MNINKIFRDDHQRKLTVELEAEPFEQSKRKAARQIAKRTRIPGFRPGKAPYGIVLRTVGEDVVIQEAMDILLDNLQRYRAGQPLRNVVDKQAGY